MTKLGICTLFLIFLLSQSTSLACTCIETDKKLDFYQYNQYYLIFQGEVISVQINETGWKQTINFKISRIYKGSVVADTLSVKTGVNGASCGLNFKVGQQWNVYSILYNNLYYTGLCTRSKEIKTGINNSWDSKQEKKFLKKFGKWSGGINRKNVKGKLANGLPEGKWVYYKDGLPWMMEEFSKGLLHGTTERYDSNGKVSFQANYEWGTFISFLL